MLFNTETLVRAAVTSIPYVGGAAAEILFGHRDRDKQLRLVAFVSDLKTNLQEINETKVDKIYLDSEEFSDFLEATLDRAARVRAEDKRKLLCHALCEQITSPIPLEFAGLFLDFVVELNSPQIHILREHATISPGKAVSSVRTPRHYSLGEGQYRYYVQVLISRGLMLELRVPNPSRGGANRPFERLEITELGREFLRFLEH